ncbi:MAG: TIGR00159 family protein [Chloroflexi bacterium]|uniref:Diadenylate cyclase n=1 Tax=Candidatus Thermofonsia Clade 3 bacterium TaxID=2364212 RepID=A0A2M8QDJ2_9CHLR|nr:MAG: TIGR00159 family protein [Candidatus Thermofonsia Clade 3 bacterium]RMG64005.1 MAG: TIGR00159 family protein [Chloroflexota bacterium]
MTDLIWVIQRLNWLAVIDIALVSLVFFGVLLLVRATQAVPLIRGMLVLGAITLLLGGTAQLPTFNLIMRTALPALLVAVPVIFQPELRRALERLGRVNEMLVAPRRTELEVMVRKISDAAQRLAARRHGALIVIERDTGLQDLIDTGVPLDAELTPDLLLTIFDPHTPLHDGGVIIRHGRVAAAGCVLPLTASTPEDARIGLRHRAGIGVTEGTDAIAVIVSEERGSISIAHNGRLIRRIEPDHLESALIALAQPGIQRAASMLPGFLRAREKQETR